MMFFLILKVSHEVILIFLLAIFFIVRFSDFVSLAFTIYDAMKFVVHFDGCCIIIF